MKIFKNSLSKSARRKWKRYGKIPIIMRSATSGKSIFTRKEFFDLGLQVQSGTQEHLWLRGEEMVKLYDLKKLK